MMPRIFVKVVRSQRHVLPALLVTKVSHFVVIEHVIVLSATTSFTRALMLWFVSHYDTVRILYDHKECCYIFAIIICVWAS